MNTNTRLVLLLFLAGCGGGAPHPGDGQPASDGEQTANSVEGTVHCQTLMIEDAISARVAVGFSDSDADIVLSTAPDACAGRSVGSLRANETSVEITLKEVTLHTSDAPSAPATFTWGDMEFQPTLWVRVGDAQCRHVMTAESLGDRGSVDLTAVAGDVFTGSFDVTLDTGERITGTFAPTACPALGSTVVMPCE